MKILHIIQRPQLRGAETFASQIAAVHKRQGHDIKFIALFDNSAKQQLDLGDIELIHLNGNEKSRLTDFSGWVRLGRLIKEFSPDIVQVNAADTLKYAVFSRLLTRWHAPLVYRNANKAGDFIKSTFKRIYNKWLVSHVDFVASVSQNCADDFIKTFNFPENRVKNMPIGTPIGNTLPVSNIRNEIGVGAHTRLLINIASFVPEKNHLGLVDIFAEISKHNGNCHLILIGDGKMRAQIEKKIEVLKLGSKVHLLGYRKDAVSILKETDLLLMPSLIEGLPGVILEAMANGVPVVASEVGGIGEVVRNSETGFLGNPAEPNTFIKPVLALLQDESKHKEITQKSFDFCAKHLDINVVAQKFMSVYQGL